MASNEYEDCVPDSPTILTRTRTALPEGTFDWRQGLSESESISVMTGPKWTRSWECVRVALAIAVLGVLSILFLFPAIVLLHYPKSYSEMGVTIEGSVVSLLGSYDTLWYHQVTVSQDFAGVEQNYSAKLFLADCLELQSSSNSSSFVFPTVTTTQMQIPLAEPLPAYYIAGSSIEITLLFSRAPPTGSGSLYLFDNYDDFVVFQSQGEVVPGAYSRAYSIDNARPSFSFTFNATGFYFLGVSLPTNTTFSYNVSSMRLFYNPANFSSAVCNLSLATTECPVSLNTLRRQACVLVQPGGSAEMFEAVNLQASHKTWNPVNTLLLMLCGCSLLLCVSVPLYYWWVLRLKAKAVARFSRKKATDSSGHYHLVN